MGSSGSRMSSLLKTFSPNKKFSLSKNPNSYVPKRGEAVPALSHSSRVKNSSDVKEKVQAHNWMTMPKGITLSHRTGCPGANHCSEQGNPQKSSLVTKRPPLILLFAWMLAKEKSLDKYRQMWFKRGFDVLTVMPSPIDLLMPPIGSKVKARNILSVTSGLIPEYNEVIVHAFCAGCYLFGETLLLINGDQGMLNVSRSIKGLIFDSPVYPKECGPGFAGALPSYPFIRPLIGSTVNNYFRLTHSFTVKSFEIATKELLTPRFKWPGLIFYSKDDIFSCVQTNEEVVKNWKNVGNQIQSKCWDVSGHVLHYKHHQKEYEQELDAFLKSLNLKTLVF